MIKIIEKASNIDGKKVYIKSRDSMYDGEWGIVIDSVPEDDEYYVAIAGGKDSVPMFSRKELKVCKNQ